MVAVVITNYSTATYLLGYSRERRENKWVLKVIVPQFLGKVWKWRYLLDGIKSLILFGGFVLFEDGGGNKMIKVCALVDVMASSLETPEEEYISIQAEIQGVLGREVSFESDVMPHDLIGKKVDVYVIDYGGMMPGCDSLINSIFQEVIKQVADKPNTLFIIWTIMSEGWYVDLIKDESPELKDAPNVLFRRLGSGNDVYREALKQWIETSGK